MLGHLGIARNHPDYDALAVLDCIFGSGPGFCDRLGRIVRDELGLVYSIGGGMTDSADVVPGLFRVYAGTMPGRVASESSPPSPNRSGRCTRARSPTTKSNGPAGTWPGPGRSTSRASNSGPTGCWSSSGGGSTSSEPKHWPERIAAITPRQVRRAAKRHLQPDALYRVELGPLRRPDQRAQEECA